MLKSNNLIFIFDRPERHKLIKNLSFGHGAINNLKNKKTKFKNINIILNIYILQWGLCVDGNWWLYV